MRQFMYTSALVAAITLVSPSYALISNSSINSQTRFMYADAWLKIQIKSFLPNVPINAGYTIYESILNGFYHESTPVTSLKRYMIVPQKGEVNLGTEDHDLRVSMPGHTNFTGSMTSLPVLSIDLDHEISQHIKFDMSLGMSFLHLTG